jgi:dTDP-4-amino-4,6-dideoxygalactose transaminase
MKKIPFFDLKKVNAEIWEELKTASERALVSGWYILGQELRTFEESCSRYLYRENEGYVVGCNSGTDALIIALRAVGVGYGDEVIAPSFTAIPTISAICAIGARPVFADIDADTWVVDMNKMPGLISEKTKAIIAVHLYGNMADVTALSVLLAKLGKKHISIIEDVAQAQGSMLQGFQAGTLGRFGAFSFYPTKNIGALGDGGAISCRTESEFEHLRMLRNYGQKDRYNAEVSGGINSRLDEVQAAILSVKLKYLAEWNSRKFRMMEEYRKGLAGLPLSFQKVTSGCTPAWHLCVVALEDESARNQLKDFLKVNNIDTLIHYPIPTHKQAAFPYGCEGLAVTETLADRILSLPFNPALQAAEQDYIIETVHRFYQTRR